jgi:ribosome-binding factor A
MKTYPRKITGEMKSLCAELRPEDGLSPVALKKAQVRQQQVDHPPSEARARQYCKAVHRSLDAGLSSVCGDERLKDLTIQSVEPLHTGSRLLVILAVPTADPNTMLELERALQKAAGLLRSVIATEIQRKRTPHLTFRVVPET